MLLLLLPISQSMFQQAHHAGSILTVTISRAQHLRSVSALTTQDPYVRAKLFIDGYHVSYMRLSPSARSSEVLLL